MPDDPTPPKILTEQSRERELIRRVMDGEHELFYELIRPNERKIYAVAFTILRNEADAEDAVQEAALKAFAKRFLFS